MPSKKDDAVKKDESAKEPEKAAAPSLSGELSHDMAVLRAREHRSLIKVLEAILRRLDK